MEALLGRVSGARRGGRRRSAGSLTIGVCPGGSVPQAGR